MKEQGPKQLTAETARTLSAVSEMSLNRKIDETMNRIMESIYESIGMVAAAGSSRECNFGPVYAEGMAEEIASRLRNRDFDVAVEVLNALPRNKFMLRVRW